MSHWQLAWWVSTHCEICVSVSDMSQTKADPQDQLWGFHDETERQNQMTQTTTTNNTKIITYRPFKTHQFLFVLSLFHTTDLKYRYFLWNEQNKNIHVQIAYSCPSVLCHYAKPQAIETLFYCTRTHARTQTSVRSLQVNELKWSNLTLLTLYGISCWVCQSEHVTLINNLKIAPT